VELQCGGAIVNEDDFRIGPLEYVQIFVHTLLLGLAVLAVEAVVRGDAWADLIEDWIGVVGVPIPADVEEIVEARALEDVEFGIPKRDASRPGNGRGNRRCGSTFHRDRGSAFCDRGAGEEG
jgi:hypothetical protein